MNMINGKHGISIIKVKSRHSRIKYAAKTKTSWPIENENSNNNEQNFFLCRQTVSIA